MLRVLLARQLERAASLGGVTLASLSPSLKELHAASSWGLIPASFAHLTALRKLDVAESTIGDASLATMPPCLESLNTRGRSKLTPAAVLPHLPALQLLDVSSTAIGDALVATLPAFRCHYVTTGATLDHVRALCVLHCIDTDLVPAALADCRERGCVVLAASVLCRHDDSYLLFGTAAWWPTCQRSWRQSAR